MPVSPEKAGAPARRAEAEVKTARHEKRVLENLSKTLFLIMPHTF